MYPHPSHRTVLRGGDVHARHIDQKAQPLGARELAGFPESIHQRRNDGLPFADGKGVEDIGQGSGVGVNRRPAGDDERPRCVAVCRQRRDTGPPEKLHGVEVIHLVGDGEGNHQKVGQRALRLQRNNRLVIGQRRLVAPKGTLADYVGLVVEEAIDRVQGQAAHP
jgi:hypothetical protein